MGFWDFFTLTSTKELNEYKKFSETILNVSTTKSENIINALDTLRKGVKTLYSKDANSSRAKNLSDTVKDIYYHLKSIQGDILKSNSKYGINIYGMIDWGKNKSRANNNIIGKLEDKDNRKNFLYEYNSNISNLGPFINKYNKQIAKFDQKFILDFKDIQENLQIDFIENIEKQKEELQRYDEEQIGKNIEKYIDVVNKADALLKKYIKSSSNGGRDEVFKQFKIIKLFFKNFENEIKTKNLTRDQASIQIMLNFSNLANIYHKHKLNSKVKQFITTNNRKITTKILNIYFSNNQIQ